MINENHPLYFLSKNKDVKDIRNTGSFVKNDFDTTGAALVEQSFIDGSSVIYAVKSDFSEDKLLEFMTYLHYNETSYVLRSLSDRCVLNKDRATLFTVKMHDGQKIKIIAQSI